MVYSVINWYDYIYLWIYLLKNKNKIEHQDVSLYYYLGIFLVILGSVASNIMGADIISNELLEYYLLAIFYYSSTHTISFYI